MYWVNRSFSRKHNLVKTLFSKLPAAFRLQAVLKPKLAVSSLLLLLVLAACQPAANTPAPASTPITPSVVVAPTISAQPQPAPTQENTPTLAAPNLPPALEEPLVFYEIFVRSFYDSNGDGIGDLQGVLQKLDYLNDGDPATTTDLGINGIWLMPIYPSPSYHGYDVTDYRAINPDYGTMQDFDALLQAAHQRGIKILLDFEINHTSDLHPWFAQAQNPASPYHNWYIWSDTDPGYAGPWNAPAWHQAENGKYYYGVFWSGMPDLNYRQPAVADEMLSIARYWLDEHKVDGFRLDGVRHILEDGKKQVNTPETKAWLADFSQQLHQTHPEALVLGEVWDSSYAVLDYLKKGSLDLAFNFDMAGAFLDSVNRADGDNLMKALRLENEIFQSYPTATFLSNHDQVRVMTTLNRQPEKAKAAASLLFNQPGVPFIYYGEEIGMTGQKPDEFIRTPMQWSSAEFAGFSSANPWQPINTNFPDFNVANQLDDPDSLLSHYRNLIHFRLARPWLQTGKVQYLQATEKALFAALLENNDNVDGVDEALLVLINLGEASIPQPALSTGEPLGFTPVSITTVLGETQAALPTLTSQGSLENYQPVDQILPFQTLIWRLAP